MELEQIKKRRARARKYAARKYAERTWNDQCRRCGGEPVEGQTLCEPCRHLNSWTERQNRKAQKEGAA